MKEYQHAITQAIACRFFFHGFIAEQIAKDVNMQ